MCRNSTWKWVGDADPRSFSAVLAVVFCHTAIYNSKPNWVYYPAATLFLPCSCWVFFCFVFFLLFSCTFAGVLCCSMHYFVCLFVPSLKRRTDLFCLHFSGPAVVVDNYLFLFRITGISTIVLEVVCCVMKIKYSTTALRCSTHVRVHAVMQELCVCVAQPQQCHVESGLQYHGKHCISPCICT